MEGMDQCNMFLIFLKVGFSNNLNKIILHKDFAKSVYFINNIAYNLHFLQSHVPEKSLGYSELIFYVFNPHPLIIGKATSSNHMHDNKALTTNDQMLYNHQFI